jgi:hypothetical protein
MLEIRPTCENCDKLLPNGSPDAMICSFECTFCLDCVTNVLKDVCPNCGGGFEKRPARPNDCFTINCVSNFPLSTEKKHKPVYMEIFKPILDRFRDTAPGKR